MIKKIETTVACFAIVFCILLGFGLLFSRYRFGVTVCLIILLWICIKLRYDWILRWIRVNYRLCIFIVILIGLVERICLFVACNNGVPFWGGADYSILWDQAFQWSSGNMCETKSWVTVGYYASFIYLFGKSILVAYASTVILQIVCFCLIILMVKKILGKICALFSGCMFFCSPIVSAHTFNVATEHTYVIFVLASLFMLCMLYRKESKALIAKFVVYSVGFAVLVLLAVWSRGEGILLIPLMLGCGLYYVIIKRLTLRQYAVMLLVCGIVFAGGIFCACKMHSLQHTQFTLFCSNDNLWPRLFGSNFDTSGYYSSKDKWLIYSQYINDHCAPDSWKEMSDYGIPIAFTAKCPNEIIPYVENEIFKRWHEKNIVECAVFMLKKIYFDLSDSSPFWHVTMNRVGRFFVQAASEICISLSIACIFLVVLRMRSAAVKCMDDVLLFVMLICGQLFLLCFTEVCSRYAWIIHVLLPIIAVSLLRKVLLKRLLQ